MFFHSWDGLLRVILGGVFAYIALVLILRVTGKRTLSKMNAFDFVVTVALGSTLATIILSKDVALAEGVLALALLVCLQLAVTWLQIRSRRFQPLIKAEPRLLFHGGNFLEVALKEERVTREEVLAAARAQGRANLQDVNAVVLETDGSFSVLSGPAGDRNSTLQNER
ncbi:MAG: DUF421 domain-containing protein [Candidatus Abyssobacteria bacterium SURF_5]|uniref:DUF421 domain-containing protein n=1 Tax=Abyssobacteria bacterium (strain SURF_5) TaxID=2093360 RepID=A0A3A4NKJ8_ABYX5|nr:MAG: DUF421 domain-containing protein [Candidatus Abyssubacteria bacterium SURF_5]